MTNPSWWSVAACGSLIACGSTPQPSSSHLAASSAPTATVVAASAPTVSASVEAPTQKRIVHVPGNAVTLAAGYRATCAIVEGGAVRCWGNNTWGTLGDGKGLVGKNVNSAVPVTAVGLAHAVDVAVGANHACAVLNDGSVRCWGANQFGQLGDGTRTARNTPVRVLGIQDAVEVSSGSVHTCVRLKGGGVRCWGLAREGELGHGQSGYEGHEMLVSKRPVAVVGIDNAISIDCGSEHTCAALRDGSARCWGSNHLSQLGSEGLLPGSLSKSNVPVKVAYLSDIVRVEAGDSHSCAQSRSGALFCWGDGGWYAPLERWKGHSRPGWKPIQLDAFTGVSTFDIGGSVLHDFHCAVIAEGRVACVGNMPPRKSEQRRERWQVEGLTSVVAIAAGDKHACARLSDGAVRCWGHHPGSLGDGTTVSSTLPVYVVGLEVR